MLLAFWTVSLPYSGMRKHSLYSLVKIAVLSCDNDLSLWHYTEITLNNLLSVTATDDCLQISGREMFEFNPDMALGDDEEADDVVYRHQNEDDEEVGILLYSTECPLWFSYFTLQSWRRISSILSIEASQVSACWDFPWLFSYFEHHKLGEQHANFLTCCVRLVSVICAQLGRMPAFTLVPTTHKTTCRSIAVRQAGTLDTSTCKVCSSRCTVHQIFQHVINQHARGLYTNSSCGC